MPQSLDFLFYSYNGTGVGHLRRVANISKKLLHLKPEVKIMIMSNAKSMPFDIGIANWISAPFNSIEAEMDETKAKENSDFLLNVFVKSNPKVLVFDTLIDEKLVLAATKKRCKIVLIQRAIKNALISTRLKQGYYNRFDSIIFPHAADEIPYVVRLFEKSSLSARVYIGGGVFDELLEQPVINKYELIVSFGGGGPYFTKKNGCLSLESHRTMKKKVMNVLSQISPTCIEKKFLVINGLNDTPGLYHEKELVSENIERVEWFDNFISALKSTRMCISRCGHNTFHEIIAANCPSIFVPRQGRTESQLERAKWLEKTGACIVIEEEDPFFENKVIELWHDEYRLKEMRNKLEKLQLPSATCSIAYGLIELGGI